MNIHEQIGEKVELAGVYFVDGAFRSAARILREAADIAETHADRCDAELREFAQGVR